MFEADAPTCVWLLLTLFICTGIWLVATYSFYLFRYLALCYCQLRFSSFLCSFCIIELCFGNCFIVVQILVAFKILRGFPNLHFCCFNSCFCSGDACFSFGYP